MKHWINLWTPGENASYRRKVIDLPAFRFGYETEPAWYFEAIVDGLIVRDGEKLHVRRGDGMQYSWTGDWLLKVGDEIQVVHHDQFINLYEPTPTLRQVSL